MTLFHLAPVRELRRRLKRVSRNQSRALEPDSDLFGTTGPHADCQCALHALVWHDRQRRIRRSALRTLAPSR